MLKRWAAWPRGIRWLIGIAAVVLALAIVWVLFVLAPDWLAHHDVGSAKGPLLQTARDAARGRLLTLAAGLFAAGALWFTARNFTLSREGQVTDRYTKAITQLGDKKPDVRIGGIYALERVARDSARDHPTVMEVLTAFIREHSPEHEHSHEQGPLSDPGDQEQARSTQPDVLAAVTVVCRRDAKRDIQEIDLTRAYLARTNLSGAYLVGANLTRANLTRAYLARANLSGAYLVGANLTRANLADANLGGANLALANLTRANLGGANLARAHIGGAILTGADLTDADLHDTDLRDTDLTGAYLSGATLIGVTWPENASAPEGWKLVPHQATFALSTMRRSRSS
jgi:hypothetical protein